MSQGPGLIQRRLLAIFEKARDQPLSTQQLCRQVYRVRKNDIEKKHRVAVLRAIKRLADRSKSGSTLVPGLRRLAIKGERDDVWFVYRPKGLLDTPPLKSRPAKDKRPRKHSRKLPTIVARLNNMPIKDRLAFVADIDEFPLVVLSADLIEPCLPIAHLLKPEIREKLLKRISRYNSGVWKALRKRLTDTL